MSTDALREALQNIISAYDEWANNPDLDFGSARLDDAIDRAKAVLATPACETEQLPAKGESHDFNSDNQLRHWGDDRTLDLAKIIADLTPMVERFLKREIEAPAAHQYFREEAADKLRKWRKLEAALKADREGG